MGDNGAKTNNGGGWLPLALKSPLLTSTLTMHFVRKHKKYDRFLALSHTMFEVKDATQGRMFAKAYVFLHDHLPRGLTGEYAHISGGDVMNHLLCHLNEQAASRHKTTKDANAAFDDLETWMSYGQNWRDALKHAQEVGQRDGKAPGLHSPAGILAPLIITYPDNKFKDRIGRLGIGWMLESRTKLDVQTDGFWKGINTGNLHTCFAPEANCATEVTHLADYDRLFGQYFVRAQKDMRPFCPEWAARFMVEPTEKPGEGEFIDTGSEADNPEDQALELRRLLDTQDPEPAGNLDNLGSWVAGKMAAGPGQVFDLWIRYWADRMGEAKHYEEQLIIRSLFLQSLHRLKSLSASSLGVDDAYMLLDRQDGLPMLHNRQGQANTVHDLAHIPPFSAYAAVNTRLSALAQSQSKTACQIVETTFTEQTKFFQEIFQHLSLNRHGYKLIELERLRTEAILQDEDVQRRVGKDDQEGLFKTEAIAALKLTRWQLRQLAVPGANIESILTGDQLRIHRQDQQATEPSGLPFIDLSKIMPVTPILDHDIEGETIEQRSTLVQLFGDLHSPIPDKAQNVHQAASSIALETFIPSATASTEASLNRPQQIKRRTAAPTTAENPISNTGALVSGHNEAGPSRWKPPDLESADTAEVTRQARRKTPALASMEALMSTTGVCLESDHNEAGPSKQKNPNPSITATSSPLTTATPDTSHDGCQQAKQKTPTPTHNIFAGKRRAKTHIPAKRNADGTLRAPEVINLTQDKLKEDIKTQQKETSELSQVNMRDVLEKLATDAQGARECAENQAHTVCTSLRDMDSLAQETLAELATIKRDAKEQARISTTSLEEVDSKARQLIADFASLKQSMPDITAARQSMADIAAMKQSMLDVATMRQFTAEITATSKQILAEVKGLFAKEPKPGEDGYLDGHCPAPDGWAQEVYNSMLLRAALFYMHQLEDLDDGAYPDESAMEETTSKYPNLPQEHILTALEHLHIQAYRQPFIAE